MAFPNRMFLHPETFRKLDLFVFRWSPVIENNLFRGLNRVGFPSHHLKTETGPVFETLCFLVI
jgi:hypothetical protein